MAKLYFRYGAMNSGKTTALMQVAYNYKERGMRVLILKPAIDTKGQDSIISRLGIPQISTGEILRRAIREKTPTGLEAQSYIEKGALVPDDVVVRIVRDRIAEPDCKNGYLLDGFPRTLPQAEALASFESIDVVVNLEVPASLLIHRLSGRRVCAQCGYTTHVDRGEAKCPKCGAELTQRKDDAPESVQNRLDVYEKQTKPLIDFYAEKGLLKNVDGSKPLAEVTEAILAALGSN